MSEPRIRTYNIQFWLVCLSSYLFFASFNMIIPELPDYLTSLGGQDYKGLIIGLFTIAALISRPFSGKLADTAGRIPVIFIGSFVCVIMGLLYPLLGTVVGFLILRFFHGFSTGFQPTGTTAYVADVVPINKRGEALGYMGVAGNLGFASGPSIGSVVANQFGTDAMFYLSSGIALFSVLILFRLNETLDKKEPFKLKHLAVWKESLFDPAVLPATLVMTLSSFCFGLMLTIIPDFSTHLGIANKGLFFTVFTVGSIVSRILGGKASDVYGRVPVLVIALLLLGGGMVSMAYTTDMTWFYISSILFGLGSGMTTPTLFAWTVDLGDSRNKAKSIATVYMGLEAGIFLGAIISAEIYSNISANFTWTFLSGGITCFLGLLYLAFRRSSRVSPSS